jgi:SAM-dependent methyltransferase
MNSLTRCTVCGGVEFRRTDVLWPALIREWQLSESETEYINRQQGKYCTTCQSNLRSIALANGIRDFLGTTSHLVQAASSPEYQQVRLLEINEAYSLTPLLRRFAAYTFASHPQVDMHALPYPDKTFDLVVHSDTLEHVDNPVHALSECRRVLRNGGALCFTAPMVVGRMSRSRQGLPKSYHGTANMTSDDYSVKTEFGADLWTYVLEAGFDKVTIHPVEFPAAQAITAWVTNA